MDIDFEADFETSVGDMDSEATLDNNGEDETWLARDKSSNDAVKSLDKRERVSENIFVSVIESADFIDETSLDVSDDKCSSISEEVALTVGGNDVVRTREADRET